MEHVAHMKEEKNLYRSLVWKPQEKKPI